MWSLVAMKKARRCAAAGDNSRKSETRISAIADFAHACKQKKKALPLSPFGAANWVPRRNEGSGFSTSAAAIGRLRLPGTKPSRAAAPDVAKEPFRLP